MKASKFENIIKHNRESMKEAKECVDKFYELLGMEDGSEIMNLTQVLGSLFWNKGYIIVQIPLKDKEIGAICYKGEYDGGYIVINSSLPRYNVNFALCHEACHVCVNNDMGQNQVDMYVDSTYHNHEPERMANQFAGMLLMPERQFRRMFEKFSSEKGILEKQDIEVVICKLMSYFKSPYMAVLVRLCELNLIEVSSVSSVQLNDYEESVRDIFDNNWLDMSELEPTYRDDYLRLRNLVCEIGKININFDLMEDADFNATIKNLDRLYKELKED